MDLAPRVARELALPATGVRGALELFQEGATLPFIARYRKEATGGLDEVQLGEVRDRGAYLVELEERRLAILQSLAESEVLTPELDRAVREAATKQELEDLYRPHRPKRRTRATMAVERGLLPLAEAIWKGKVDDAAARRQARDLVNPDRDVPDLEAALAGARDILAERVAEEPELRSRVRDLLRTRGVVSSSLARGAKEHPLRPRFRDYESHTEPVRSIPSHRILAIRRGESEGVLSWKIEGVDEEIHREARRVALGRRRARHTLEVVAEDAASRLLAPSVATEVAAELKDRADAEAIRVFGQNLEQLLLQPPAGERAVLGLDPGFRTGVKAAVVSATGAVLETGTLFLHREEAFRDELRGLVKRHGPELVAVGNGTASRETFALVREVLERVPADGRPQVVLVNEAGASVYSASPLAREELPGLDVTLRGAVSIARRLQDPLAELVKIDPRSIGVGQYQHDVNQPALRNRLDRTVEVCVNRVGVEVNTASPSLLAYVAGIGPTLAQRIVETRERQGGFRERRQLLDVPRLGPKAFEQAAGFLRVRGGAHPLDATAVHPERYELVAAVASDLGMKVADLVGNEAALARFEATLDQYVSERVGRPTLEDILAELRRPGRDPRDRFQPPEFRDDVRSPEDLKPGMRLGGVVTNVVAFGAFVDVGVHQDGLVHVSELADGYVRDPSEVVKVGQAVQVTVLSVDLDRGRIGLSMRAGARASARQGEER
ncbi:MAG: RNA-binding transcriptional accessory protein [Gemmatimonadales bacterium]|nr:MAG: RNA-binding transcriptional accessory protein [Gemmatimonadales bacterium]